MFPWKHDKLPTPGQSLQHSPPSGGKITPRKMRGEGRGAKARVRGGHPSGRSRRQGRHLLASRALSDFSAAPQARWWDTGSEATWTSSVSGNMILAEKELVQVASDPVSYHRALVAVEKANRALEARRRRSTLPGTSAWAASPDRAFVPPPPRPSPWTFRDVISPPPPRPYQARPVRFAFTDTL